jgi:hypothetical protein
MLIVHQVQITNRRKYSNKCHAAEPRPSILQAAPRGSSKRASDPRPVPMGRAASWGAVAAASSLTKLAPIVLFETRNDAVLAWLASVGVA